jgi:hypothetical protein
MDSNLRTFQFEIGFLLVCKHQLNLLYCFSKQVTILCFDPYYEISKYEIRSIYTKKLTKLDLLQLEC